MTEQERWEIIDGTSCTCLGGLHARDRSSDHAYPTCPQYLGLELTRAVQALDEGFTQEARVTLMRVLGRLTGRA